MTRINRKKFYTLTKRQLNKNKVEQKEEVNIIENELISSFINDELRSLSSISMEICDEFLLISSLKVNFYIFLINILFVHFFVFLVLIFFIIDLLAIFVFGSE